MHKWGEGQGGGNAVIIRKGLCPGNRYSVSYSGLKGQSNEIFNLPFFYNSNQHWLLTNGLKYFRFWLRIRKVIQILSSKIWLPGVSYPSESDSPWYHTPVSQSPQGIILRRVNLPELSNPCESISPGYQSPGDSIKNPPRHDSLGYPRQVNLPGVS